ncbi:hypothetical protein D3C71_1357030 [compost metagenome]
MPGIRAHDNSGVTHLVSKAQPIMQTRLIDLCFPFEQIEEVFEVFLREPSYDHRTDVFFNVLQPAVLSGTDLRAAPIVERDLFEQRRRLFSISCYVIARQACTQNVVHVPRMLSADIDKVG